MPQKLPSNQSEHLSNTLETYQKFRGMPNQKTFAAAQNPFANPFANRPVNNSNVLETTQNTLVTL